MPLIQVLGFMFTSQARLRDIAGGSTWMMFVLLIGWLTLVGSEGGVVGGYSCLAGF